MFYLQSRNDGIEIYIHDKIRITILMDYMFQDHDFFQHLEMHMRSENPPLCGRDHLSFRSYYYSVKVKLF